MRRDADAPGPLPAAMAPLAWCGSVAYGACVRARNAAFDAGLGIHRAPLPVISVGNIVAGGTGKSPMVRHAARLLLDAGIRPAILLRGYKGGTESDEAEEHRRMLPGIPVVAAPDRVRASGELCARDPSVEAIILDDGFQHRRLARDADIVLIDAHMLTGSARRLLPLGWAREPVRSLARATAVVVTRASRVEPALDAAVRRWHGKAPLAWCDHEWTGLIEFKGGVARAMPVDALRGTRCVALAAIARPAAFLERLRAAGAEVVETVLLPDHSRPDPAAIRQACATGAGRIVCTGKDWSKVERLIRSAPDLAGLTWLVPEVGLRFIMGEEALAEHLRSSVRGSVPPPR